MAAHEKLAQGAARNFTGCRRFGNRSLIRAGSERRWFLPRRRSDVFLFIAAVAVLLITAAPIDAQHVGRPEAQVFHWVNDLPSGLYWPIWVVMQLGNLLAVPAAAVVALLARRVRLALYLILAGAAAWLLAKVVKQVAFRGRPGQLLDHVVLHHAPSAGHGFVAGHAATAFALASVAFPFLGRRTRWVVIALAVVVCFGRVYVGAHLPLDVAGGAALGVAIGALVHLLLGAPDDARRTATRLDVP
jgi:membrane-associated phospholipid phosphatase